jgi:hypothetical protein
MQERFLMEATKYNMFPLDNSFTANTKTVPNEEWSRPLFLTRPSPAQAYRVSSRPEVEKEFRRRARHLQTKSLAGTQPPLGIAADRRLASALFR